MKLEEIIATKLKCLMQRQHAPDLFDYVYSVRLLGGELNKQEVVETLIQKTIFAKNPHVLKDTLNMTAFDYFRIYWAKGVVCAKEIVMDVEDAISSFLADLEDLFSIYPNDGYMQFVYFPADIRSKIMKAGREQTLLKIVYNNAERVVEPYSLKYLEKKSGEEKEYFYVFNQSGGNSAPGVRSLLPTGFQSIENTEEKFMPQFPVELSKSGEAPENPYLFDPNRPAKVPRTNRIGRSVSRRNFSSSGIKYIYECPYCGRKFTRSSYDSHLNPHKDKNGYPCGGRYGIYVDTRY